MFTEVELNILIAALDKEIASQKRAANTSTRPEFKELASRLEAETQTLKAKITAARSKLLAK